MQESDARIEQCKKTGLNPVATLLADDQPWSSFSSAAVRLREERLGC